MNNIKENYLTRRGYAIYKSNYNLKELDKIRKNLTVSPFICDDFGISPPTFPVYLESPQKFYLPKHYGINNYGNPSKIILKEPTKIDINFNGSIRDNQLIPVDNFIKSCNLDGEYLSETLNKYSYGGIISLPCGWGKTIIALYIASILKVKTLIIVHKEFLVNQWKERIEQFLPNASIGIIQQKHVDIIGKDIVIGMLQSISMREYPEYVFEDFGFTIVDECHHLGAEVFSRSLPKYSTKYMLGLSATPKRKDGLSKVFEWYLGPYLFVVNQQNTKKVRVNIVQYYNPNPAYNNLELSNNGRLCIARMTNNICEFNRRNEVLLEIFKRCCEDGHESQTIGLSDRREHLKYLHDTINERKIGSVGYYVGGMKQKDLKESESKKCLLGTFSMASEAMDIPSLNRLILMSSHSDVIQSCGRILRKDHELVPVIWDFVDNFSVFANQAKKRLAHYRKENYDIYMTTIFDDDVMELDELFKKLNNFEEVKGKNKNLMKQNEKKEEKCLIVDDDY